MNDHILYRLFNSNGDLIYIGITYDIDNRLRQHSQDAIWWGDVAHCHSEVGYPSRDELEQAEWAAIKAERPWYNIVGNDYRRQHPLELERSRRYAELLDTLISRRSA